MMFTGKGDDGTTGLLGNKRVLKSDIRMEALGTLDEASAAIGLARSLLTNPAEAQFLLEIQRLMYHMMAEIAATPDNVERFRKIDSESVRFIETRINLITVKTTVTNEFILPGDSTPSASLSLARTIVRRSERRVVEMTTNGLVENPSLIAFLNRLSSYLFILELSVVQQTGRGTPSLAKGE